MGKTFRKNPECGGTSASHVRRYRTHSRSKSAVNMDMDEFRRGRNYKKSVVAWNPAPHGRRAPGKKGTPVAYAESAKARRQHQIARQAQFVEDDSEECCEQESLDTGSGFTAQELAAVAEWSSPLVLKLGSDIFRMADTYTYTLLEDEYSPTPSLAREIGGKYYVIAIDTLMDYPDLAYDDDLWIVHSIGIVLWSTTLILPEDKNAGDLVGSFVNF